MKAHFITIFPNLITDYLKYGLMKKALDQGLFEIAVYDLRDYSDNKTRRVDDRVYGGGAGMVLSPEPLARAIGAVRATRPSEANLHVVYPSPAGKPFVQADAVRFSKMTDILFICGRYEGIDERIIELYVDEECSLGDFVLTGGELPALAMTEAAARCIPQVIGHLDVHLEESFSHLGADGATGDGALEYPHYTRPECFEGRSVPSVLLSGHRAEIDAWRRMQSRVRTETRRPDLLKKK